MVKKVAVWLRNVYPKYAVCTDMADYLKLARNNLHFEYFTSVYVVILKEQVKVNLNSIPPDGTRTCMPNILKRFILKCFEMNTINTVSFGYQREAGDMSSLKQTTPNPSIKHLSSDPWEWLLSERGDKWMFTFLLDGNVFLYTSSGGLSQLVGYPVSEINFAPVNNLDASNELIIAPGKTLYRQGRLPKDGWKIDFNMAKPLSRHLHFELLNYYCPRRQTESVANAAQPCNNVARFLVNVSKRVFSKYFGGGCGCGESSKWRDVKRIIYAYVRLGRYERLRIDAEHLQRRGLTASRRMRKKSTNQKHPSLEWIHFYFTEFIPRLITTSFHVTDTSISTMKHTLLYFRHDDWNDKLAVFKSDFIASNLVPIGYPSPSTPSSVKLRFSPKGNNNSFRPIINMKSVNKQNACKSALAVLDYHVDQMRRSGQIMASVTGGLGEIHARFREYLHVERGPLCLAKVDIEKCFDRIPIDRLFNVLEHLLTFPEYNVYKYDTVRVMGDGQILKRYHRVAVPSGCAMPASLTGKGLVIHVDRCQGKPMKREAVLKAIRDSTILCTVSLDNKLYRLKTGIPQGSSLSCILCSLFYAHMDTHFLNINQNDVFTARYIDDMLIAGEDEEQVLQIVDRLSTGFPEYGFSINREKTEFVRKGTLQWCGMLVDSKLHTRPVLPNTSNTAMSVEYAVNPGRALLRFVDTCLRTRLHGIFFNSDLNSVDVNLENALEVYSWFVARIKLYVRKHDSINNRQKLSQRLIEKALRMGRKRVTRYVSKHCDLPVWLVNRSLD